MGSGGNYAQAQPWTWKERLLVRLFPTRYCALPEAPESFRDVLVVETCCGLDWIDRLRVLLTGKLVVKTRTATENIVGQSITTSTCYVPLRFNR